MSSNKKNYCIYSSYAILFISTTHKSTIVTLDSQPGSVPRTPIKSSLIPIDYGVGHHFKSYWVLFKPNANKTSTKPHLSQARNNNGPNRAHKDKIRENNRQIVRLRLVQKVNPSLPFTNLSLEMASLCLEVTLILTGLAI